MVWCCAASGHILSGNPAWYKLERVPSSTVRISRSTTALVSSTYGREVL